MSKQVILNCDTNINLERHYYLRKSSNGDLELWRDCMVKNVVSQKHTIIRPNENYNYLIYRADDYLPDYVPCTVRYSMFGKTITSLITCAYWVPTKRDILADRIPYIKQYRSIFLFDELCFIKKLERCNVVRAYTIEKNEFIQVTTSNLMFDTNQTILDEAWYIAVMNGTIGGFVLVKILDLCPTAFDFIMSNGRNFKYDRVCRKLGNTYT